MLYRRARRTRACSTTAFGARDPSFFDAISCRASRRRLMRNPFGGTEMLSLKQSNLLLSWLSGSIIVFAQPSAKWPPQVHPACVYQYRYVQIYVRVVRVHHSVPL